VFYTYAGKQVKPVKKLYVTDGTKEKFPGLGLFFLRINTKPITVANIAQELYFGALEGDDLLEALERLIAQVFLPALKQQTNWGALSNDANGHILKENFLGKLAGFVSILSNARASIADAVQLSPCTHTGLAAVSSPADIVAAAGSTEMVEAAETTALQWCKEITQILTKSEQMRKESDTVGPRAELEHWKKRMAKFDSLTFCVKSPQCRAVINVLVAAKSKALQSWKELDMTITDFTNETKDNVKFLHTLEKYCEPLYKCNPVTMLDSIPGLMNAIRMINSYSRYYNTSERMTALFVKVTNQMITACRAHITDSGYSKLWDLERNVALERLSDCQNLNNEYQLCFQRTKEKLKGHPEERPFDFSEMYIFGKFNNFCRRLENIIEFLKTVATYETLSLSRIEGIETFNARFGLIVSTLKKKPHDPLEHRKPDFDVDYQEFKLQLADLEVQIQAFMDSFFESAKTVMRGIEFTQRFERLRLPCLKILEKWKFCVTLFVKDIDFIQKQYNEQKDKPPIARNMPPIAGRIAWSQQLYRRLKEPVDIFRAQPELIALAETRRAIKAYNRIAKALVEYEVVFLQVWKRQVDETRGMLNCTILVRDPDSLQLVVNMDKKVFEMIREVGVLRTMGFEIPLAARNFAALEGSLKSKFDGITFIVEENDRIRSKISEISPTELFSPLMEPHLEKVDEVISPGLTVLRWTSLNIDSFLKSVEESLKELELLVERVSNTYEFQIQGVLTEIRNMELCALPDSEPWTVDEFVNSTQNICEAAAVRLDTMTMKVERAAHDLVNILISSLDVEVALESAAGSATTISITIPKKEDIAELDLKPGELTKMREAKKTAELRSDALNLLDHFEHANLDAHIKLTRNTLEGIRRRVTPSSSLLYGDASVQRKHDHRPAFKVYLALAIPNVMLKPRLEDIQASLNMTVQLILSVYKTVYQWRQPRELPGTPLGGGSQGASSTHLSAAPNQLASSVVMQSSRSQLTAEAQKRHLAELKNFFCEVSQHKEVAKLTSVLSTTFSSARILVEQALKYFEPYQHLWMEEKEESIAKYLESKPLISDFEARIKAYKQMESVVKEGVDELPVGTLVLVTEDLKIAMAAEANAWKVLYGRKMNTEYLTLMENIMEQIEDLSRRLSRPIKDLDDVRQAMATLKEIREKEIYIDSCLGPVEETYSLLAKFGIQVAREEADKVDTFRYSWQKLLTLVRESQAELIKIQPQFKETLITNVEVFQKDTTQFYDEYDTQGPMVQGLVPRDANDRLYVYQTRFDDLWRRFQIYTDGEELFGMAVSDYPDLGRIKKELNLLQKLYGLYNSVMDSIDGYYDILWAEVDIDKINNELIDFQNKCRKLPKALKEWEAFNDLKKKIDDFNETCPLLEMMANKAMLERHWKRMAEVTGHSFDTESESFQLRNIMEAPLLKFREDIEDICISAVKERDIEAKMKQVKADWAVQNFAFAPFKTRGELLLRGEETQEIISLMEDSLMVLGSLMSNRYNAPFKKEIQLWVQKLSNSTEIIESWLIVQNLWVYLEAVFVGGDIAKQLPMEAKRFGNIDKSWVKILTKAHETPNVVTCCVGDETLGQLLPHLLEQLELCQKSLTGYLEKKRLVFPRFFFVSDPALLEILGQASDSHTIQAHLLSVFDNIKSVTFHEKEYDRITHIHSREPETIELDKAVMTTGNVEHWLGALLKQALHSVHVVIKNAYTAISDPNIELIEFLNSYPAQVTLRGA
jgi:dynein heavy chain